MPEIFGDTISLKKGTSSAVVHLFGATLISWKPNGKEVLFVSQNSKFDNQKPIRGGVPVIFPQFGPWELGPQHGFARRMMWSVKGGNLKDETDTVTLTLEDTDSSRKMWNYKFLFEYTLCLVSDSEIKMDVTITNKGYEDFNFTFLLHTYFSVPEVTNCKISGLKDCSYVDKVRNGEECKEKNEDVMLSEFTDRVYQNTPTVQIVKNASNGKNVKIEKINLPDTVVWNPWAENARKMDDFGDDEWKNMICVESGYVSRPFTLEPGKTFQAGQLLTVE